MNLESQVVNLELSKKLHSLNVKQVSLFYYANEEIILHDQIKWLSESKEYFVDGGCGCCSEGEKINKLYSAFTASELLEILSLKYVECIEIESSYVLSEDKPIYRIKNNSICFDIKNFHEENLCNALAKMLIHLIENKLIEV